MPKLVKANPNWWKPYFSADPEKFLKSSSFPRGLPNRQTLIEHAISLSLVPNDQAVACGIFKYCSSEPVSKKVAFFASPVGKTLEKKISAFIKKKSTSSQDLYRTITLSSDSPILASLSEGKTIKFRTKEHLWKWHSFTRSTVVTTDSGISIGKIQLTVKKSYAGFPVLSALTLLEALDDRLESIKKYKILPAPGLSEYVYKEHRQAHYKEDTYTNMVTEGEVLVPLSEISFNKDDLFQIVDMRADYPSDFMTYKSKSDISKFLSTLR